MKSSLPGVSLSGKPLNACTKKKDLDTGEGGSLFGEPAVPNTEGADFPSLSEQKDHIISEQLARLDEQKKKITGTRQQLEDCDGSEDDDAKCGYVVRYATKHVLRCLGTVLPYYQGFMLP